MRNAVDAAFGSIVLSLAVAFPAAGQFDASPQQPAPSQPGQAAPQLPDARAQPDPQRQLVATVNGEGITQAEFQQHVNSAIQARAQQTEEQPRLTPQEVQQLQGQVLDNIIEGRLVEQHVREHGPEVAPEEVESVIQRFQQNLQAQGSTLQQYLASNQQRISDLRKRVEGSLAWSKFQQQEMSPDRLQAFYEDQQRRFGEATFEQVEPQVRQLYVAKIWEEIVKQAKPQAQIQVAQPEAPQLETPPPPSVPQQP